MEIGKVLSDAWSLYARHLGRFFLTALVVYVVLDLLSAVVDEAAGDSVLAGVVWGLIAAALSIVGFFWVQGALVETVRDVRDGRTDRTIGETYRAVQSRLPALIAAGIVAGIAIVIGLLLLIVPGLFLITIWSMIGAVIVLEGRSAGESFGRSREIVRGNGWSVFGLLLIVFILVAIAEEVIGLLFTPLPDFLDTWLGGLVAHSLTIPFAVAALTTAYFTLTAAEGETAPPAATA
jgi:hypothetical protein